MTVSLPESDLAPLHPVAAVQVVASALVQVRMLEPPGEMLVGDALKVTDGALEAAVTVTVAERCALPPAPVQASV